MRRFRTRIRRDQIKMLEKYFVMQQQDLNMI